MPDNKHNLPFQVIFLNFLLIFFLISLNFVVDCHRLSSDTAVKIKDITLKFLFLLRNFKDMY